MERGNLTRQIAKVWQGDVGRLVWAPHPEGRWEVWEKPLVGCRYLVSVRPGGPWKLVAGKRDRERSVVLVLRKGYEMDGSGAHGEWQPARLVARLRAPAALDPTPLAELAAAVAQWYGEALCFVEVKDSAITAKEVQRLGAGVQVREVLDKTNGEWTREIGWLTDEESGPAALNALQNAIRESAVAGSRLGLRMECGHCRRELECFVEAQDGVPLVEHDDDVRALATGVFNLDAASLYHPDTRARQRPRDGWVEVDSFGGAS